MFRLRTLMAAALVLSFQGCGHAQDSADQQASFIASQVADAKNNGSAGQRAVVADSKVDGSEYETQFDALRTCVESGGGTFTEYGLSKFDGLTLEFDVASRGVKPDEISQLRQRCFGEELLYAQAIYLVTHTNVIDPAILQRTSSCLTQQGVELTGSETNLEQLSAAAKPLLKSSTPVFRCADTAAHAAYPKEYAHRDVSMGF